MHHALTSFVSQLRLPEFFPVKEHTAYASLSDRHVLESIKVCWRLGRVSWVSEAAFSRWDPCRSDSPHNALTISQSVAVKRRSP